MRWPSLRLTLAIAVACAAISIAAQDKPPTPAEEYAALKKEFEQASRVPPPKDQDERLRMIGQGYRRRGEYAQKLVAFAEKHPKDSVALEALIQAVWQVNTTPWPVEMVGSDPARPRAFELLQRDHLASDQLGPLCQRVSWGLAKEYESFLRAVAAKSPHPAVQAIAKLSLGQHLHRRLERVGMCREAPEHAKEFAGLFGQDYLTTLLRRDQAQAMKEVEVILEEAAAKHGDVKLPNTDATVGDRARTELFGIRHLSVGKQAPETEGIDQDGKAFKLSDYRGKVVLLDFWSYV